MLEFLQKFNNLPIELREKVSAPAVMQSISEIEKKYSISLATLIMKVMVKDIKVADLEKYFTFEYNLADKQAELLAIELKKKIFFDVSDYLGFDKNKIEAKDLDTSKNIFFLSSIASSSACLSARLYSKVKYFSKSATLISLTMTFIINVARLILYFFSISLIDCMTAGADTFSLNSMGRLLNFCKNSSII
jgi:hypothetical protein